MSERYAGIGSRKTPDAILRLMTEFAYVVGRHGWLLRSGAATGADQAFEAGADLGGSPKEIFLPWPGYENCSHATRDQPSPEAYEIAKQYHPAWHRLSQGAQKLIARNSHQVLGKDLDDPVDLVVCWTEGAKLKGGTAQALRIALDHDVPIRNVGDPDDLAAMTEIARGKAP